VAHLPVLVEGQMRRWAHRLRPVMMPRPASCCRVVLVGAHDVVDEAVFGGQYRVVDVGVEGQDDRGVPVAADGADGVVSGHVALV